MNINRLIEIPKEYKHINEKLKYLDKLKSEFQELDNMDMDYADRLHRTEYFIKISAETKYDKIMAINKEKPMKFKEAHKVNKGKIKIPIDIDKAVDYDVLLNKYGPEGLYMIADKLKELNKLKSNNRILSILLCFSIIWSLYASIVIYLSLSI